MLHTKTAPILGLTAFLAFFGAAACDAGDKTEKPQPPAVSAPQTPAASAASESAPVAVDGYNDIVLGDPKAPLEVVEYASMTCSHCAAFNREVIPEFKRAYVDTGKAKYVMRHFVLNGPDLAASMIARCGATDPKRYYGYIDLFLNRQAQWIPGWQAIGEPPQDATLAELALQAKMDIFVRPTGMARDKVEACLKNDALRNDLLRRRAEGVEQHQVKGTPTIFINDKLYEGAHTFDEFDKALRAAM